VIPHPLQSIEVSLQVVLAILVRAVVRQCLPLRTYSLAGEGGEGGEDTLTLSTLATLSTLSTLATLATLATLSTLSTLATLAILAILAILTILTTRASYTSDSSCSCSWHSSDTPHSACIFIQLIALHHVPLHHLWCVR
jgi:hypothetical protein